MLSDLVQYIYLGKCKYFYSIFHYFTLSALKLVKLYKRLRAVSKAESEGCMHVRVRKTHYKLD